MAGPTLRVHWLQHVPFEGLGSIGSWLAARDASVSTTRLYESPGFPSPDDFDALIVMGGPMSVNDEAKLPWLVAEKRFVGRAIDAGRRVLGICLGAQLVAASRGALVRANDEREIGWYRVEAQERTPFADLVAPECPVFHWHGETFDLPAGAVHLARSAGCSAQAFALGPNVLALQFHLEMTAAGARALIEHCPADLAPGRYVQTAAAMLADPERFERANAAMDALLKRFVGAQDQSML
jgi:GMP synthase-like glutamine amidotransferase